MTLIPLSKINEKYPFIKSEMKWSNDDIQLFFDSFLLAGEIQNGQLFIDISSFEQLINYHREVNKNL